jgi:dihydrofolate reductase
VIKGIVAVGENWEIGKNNGLLFSLKKDMQHFKTTTMNKIVVMGENTLLSFPGGRPLKNRVNIVLCPEGHEYENCICFHNFEQMVKFVQVLAKEYDVFVIGGGMMYKSMLPYYDEVIVTKVLSTDPEATVFFPNLDKDVNFEEIDRTDNMKDENYIIHFSTYRRIEPNQPLER